MLSRFLKKYLSLSKTFFPTDRSVLIGSTSSQEFLATAAWSLNEDGDDSYENDVI